MKYGKVKGAPRNAARRIKASYARMPKPGSPMKTVLKGRVMTKKKP